MPSDGIALGHVALHEPRVVITNYIAEDLPKETGRLELALTKLRADLDRTLERGDVADGGEHREVLEAYRMFANDHGWSHKLHEAVGTGLNCRSRGGTRAVRHPRADVALDRLLICATACTTSRISAIA